MAHVPHLYVASAWGDSHIELSDRAAHHLVNVLRLRRGSAVTYTDGAGVIGRGSLDEGAVLRGREETVARSGTSLTLAVAPPRVADRARMVVEKLTELGVDRLVWLTTTRGEGSPPRRERAQAWSRAALEQSRGAWSLEISGPQPAAGPWDPSARLLICDGEGGRVGDVVPGDQPIVGLVGPEGGFVPNDLPAHAARVALGDAVLRVETAAIAFAAVIRALEASSG